ncbi:putative membrane protein [Thermosporothrix hazakensis]|jgi:uncharacterized membrane protein|uniref:Inner membrane protein YgaP-like transmembrane domain-containing protein n=2 Tax=Thermosporothrix TaxID=768650 RepID=A0A455SB92_9CHLR|nr:SRPBCC family protein [Thermosporothrix hazakensis]PZW29441.1 putative membrane protein [Thermosporothrix hazakensis]BBH85727.1 hypothetical protein KTC_04780 [Thermosporothrix sp. COM3]GCE45844.1 hypothetical protein KTH_07130 [Thermosporothrix hazakensis]
MTVASEQDQRDTLQLKYDPRSWQQVNVGREERLLSTIAGAALTLCGLWRRKTVGLTTALGGLLLYRGLTGRSVLYRLLDLNTVKESPSTVMPLPDGSGVRVKRAVTILRPADELYHFWRDFAGTVPVHPFVEQITPIGDKSWHWLVRLPGGEFVEWDSVLTEDIPERLIAWRFMGERLESVGGRIRFDPAPADQGTIVTLEVEFKRPDKLSLLNIIPSGMILSRVPEQLVREELRRLKALMEAGELPQAQPRESEKEARRNA